MNGANFQQILDSANIGILAFDGKGRLFYLNPAAEEILRGSLRALRGMHYRTLFSGSPGVARVVRKTLRENTPVSAFDAELRPRGGAGGEPGGTGAAQPVIVGASPFAGPSGEPQGVVLSVKTAEILSLMEREERAQESVLGLQTISYGIAHEIKNPLGGILGAAQWLARGEGGAAERDEGIRLILREAGRINDLVEKMLEAGRVPPPPRRFAVFPVLQEAIALLSAEARAGGKTIAFDLAVDPSLPDVLGHPDTFFRAVVNVLKNAVEAIDRRGRIHVTAAINVNYRLVRGRGPKRSFLEVGVSDDGEGMGKEEVRKALLPFYTTKPKGTGLGLPLVRHAVLRQGGKLEIKSVRGKGTTVTISLPLDPGKR